VDNRTNPQAPFLYVSGTIQNFGMNNSSGYGNFVWYGSTYSGYYEGVYFITAYRIDGSLALQRVGELDNISGQSSQNISLTYSYSGDALASWTICVAITAVD
jgi:hypothetical protein